MARASAKAQGQRKMSSKDFVDVPGFCPQKFQIARFIQMSYVFYPFYPDFDSDRGKL